MWFGSRTLIFKSGMLIHLYGCHCQVSLRVFFSLSSRQVIDAFNELLVNNVPPGVRWSGVTPNSWHHGSEHRRMPPWMLAIWSFFGNDDQHFSEPLDLGAPYFRPHFDRKSRVAQVGHHSSRRQYQVGPVGIESHLFIDGDSQMDSSMVTVWLSISRRVSMARDIFLVFYVCAREFAIGPYLIPSSTLNIKEKNIAICSYWERMLASLENWVATTIYYITN